MYFRAVFSDGPQKIVPRAISVFAHPTVIQLVISTLICSCFSNIYGVKGGCAHLDMYILHSKLIDLDPRDTFCTILPQGFFLFSLLGQKQVCDTGDEAVMKIHKKIKIGIPINMYIFCYNFQSKVNLKLKF